MFCSRGLLFIHRFDLLVQGQLLIISILCKIGIYNTYIYNTNGNLAPIIYNLHSVEWILKGFVLLV